MRWMRKNIHVNVSTTLSMIASEGTGEDDVI